MCCVQLYTEIADEYQSKQSLAQNIINMHSVDHSIILSTALLALFLLERTLAHLYQKAIYFVISDLRNIYQASTPNYQWSS